MKDKLEIEIGWVCPVCGKGYAPADNITKGAAEACRDAHSSYQVHPVMAIGEEMPIAVEVTRIVGGKTTKKAVYTAREIEPLEDVQQSQNNG